MALDALAVATNGYVVTTQTGAPIDLRVTDTEIVVNNV